MTRFALAILIPALSMAAGPVEIHTSATAITLANDYLERTISLADGDVGTREFLNKITGRAYFPCCWPAPESRGDKCTDRRMRLVPSPRTIQPRWKI